MSNPPGQAGPWSDNPSYEVHAWIGFKGKTFPCGGYPKGPVTTYRAGDIIQVRFWNHQVKDYQSFPPPDNIPQARHGGGACEFSLSYDGGKTWNVIGQYTKTCPDIYYEWPVQIPANVPSCTDSDRCLFAWSWTAYATNQFYHHCANVVINSADPNGSLPPLEMTVTNVEQIGQKADTNAEGDKIKTKSTGPNKNQTTTNTNGFYAAGGAAGTQGIDLGLNTIKGKTPPPDEEDDKVGSGKGGDNSSGGNGSGNNDSSDNVSRNKGGLRIGASSRFDPTSLKVLLLISSVLVSLYA
ncbi:hypothetical protein BCR41DRAFT_391392 [Lobosporangium transversale]|uniref:Chitin-binding type-4 domain-containing protein n=1 Tax=Lobosporangium transversale TaxID=64571 RepID=A0A1Y2H347_9FUNG|nr:hypothetical protein BCR41DRAFT_391392 [Lobosporangium transversale]ORZ28978.1 hypothetical protein BCR41DRAFT_391392 [Lobosporangium transversale]|eukprot:XP_021886651.1 hypothetical protein BCR41DRAFT_391392 [Lobosporangium transversale]